jgi:hypothetical protein
MALDPAYFFYADGTITLTNGSDIATGEFTAWDPAVLPFDFVYPNDGTAGMSVIKEVLGMEEIRLAKPWTGPTLTNVPYFMVRWTRHTDPRIYGVRLSDYLARLKGIPENLEELAQQMEEDAAAVAAALPIITQAAADVEADRQAVAGDLQAAISVKEGAEAALAAAEEVLQQVEEGSVADGAITDVKVAANAAIDASKLSFLRQATGAKRMALDVIVGADTVHAREFLSLNGSDDTANLRNAFNAAKNKRLILPSALINVASTPEAPAIVIDPLVNYQIIGEGGGYPNMGTILRDNGSGRLLSADNTNGSGGAGPAGDQLLHIQGIGFEGNRWAQEVIYLNYITRANLDRIWVSGAGYSGIRMRRCFNSTVKNVYVTRCGRHGIWLEEQANNVVIEDCRAIANSRNSGFAGINITGSLTLESYGLQIVRTDCSYNGTTSWDNPSAPVAEAYGMIAVWVEGLTLNGFYCEQAPNKPTITYQAAYIANSRAIIMTGGLILDGVVQFETGVCKDVFLGPNIFLRQTANTGVTAGTNAGDNFRYMNQSLIGGATQVISGAGASLI